MACYDPTPALQLEPGGPVTLWPSPGDENLELPCGKCLGCRQARATSWALRATHEAHGWNHNSLITLTYNDAALPESGHLCRRDLTLFIKRLRKEAARRPGKRNRTPPRIDSHAHKIRFLACGEYGSQTQRPHYHILAFNCRFTDTKRIAISEGHPLYESQTLSALWSRQRQPLGHCSVGEATPGAAAGYIAKYALKYAHGDRRGMVDQDGVYKPRPFLAMSLRPAIGHYWLQAYYADLTHGYCVDNNTKHTVPRYYRNQLKEGNTQQQLTAELLAYYQHLHRQKELYAHPTETRTRKEIRFQQMLIHEQKHRKEHRR